MRLVLRRVELMLVVVGQEAGGVSEAAASCRRAAAAATHVPCDSCKRGDPASGRRAAKQRPGWHNAKILNLKTGQLPSLELRQRECKVPANKVLEFYFHQQHGHDGGMEWPHKLLAGGSN